MEEDKNPKLSEKMDFEAKQNWLGFWNLLLEIDRRINPQLYKKPKNNEDNGSSNNPNKA